MKDWTARVRRAFDGAGDYDGHAVVQAEVANWLADVIADTGPHARVLEIGCGTGLLTAAARTRSGTADWLMTDLAPAMVARAQERFGNQSGVRFAVLDGCKPALPEEPAFDLVCSSLAAQWFDDLAGALGAQLALIRPGGRLLLTTLSHGTFATWRQAAIDVGAAVGTMDFPLFAALRTLRLPGAAISLRGRRLERPARSGLDFLRALKALGAGTSRPGHRPISPRTLRDAMHRFEQMGGRVEYEVALLSIRRKEDA